MFLNVFKLYSERLYIYGEGDRCRFRVL